MIGEVAVDDAEDVAGATGPDHRHARLGRDRDGTVLRVRRAALDIATTTSSKREARVVHGERREALHLRRGWG